MIVVLNRIKSSFKKLTSFGRKRPCSESIQNARGFIFCDKDTFLKKYL